MCLQYTAGEDYALDERLVRYDVRASIAHAEMLRAQKLLSDADLHADPHGPRKLWRMSTRMALGTSSSAMKMARRRSRSA